MNDASGAAGTDETAATSDDLRPAQRERRAASLGRRAPLIGGAVAIGAAAVLGMLIAVRGGVLDIDDDWADEIAEARGPVGDAFSLFMNALGGGIVGVFVVPLGIALLLLVWRRPWAAVFFLSSSAASAAVVQVLKHVVGRARPEDMLVASDFGSFPSGHVANAATIAVALAIIIPRRWVYVLGAAYTLLMAMSRTYLGVHWLTDTIGGVLVGLGVTMLVWVLFARPLERERLARLAIASERNAAAAQLHVTPPLVPRAGSAVSGARSSEADAAPEPDGDVGPGRRS